jgi:DNA primase
MNSVFLQIKSALDLRTVIPAESGLQMGRHHLEECPFCHGHNCFSIAKNGQAYKCFQCSEAGDVFDFIAKYHGTSEQEALLRCAETAGITLEEKKKAVRLSKAEKVLLIAARYYHEHVQINGAKQYFLDTRKHSLPVIQRMKVGWSDGQLHKHLLKEGFNEEDILASGLVRKNDSGSLYDLFAPHLAIFPHIHGDRVLHFSCKDPAKQKPPYQLPLANRHKSWLFYNQSALDRHKSVLLVEGENDTLSVLDAGITNVAGLIGQISEEQLKTLKTQGNAGKQFVLWMDNDFDPAKPLTKGYGYIRKISKELTGADVRVIVYPSQHKDPDEYLHSLPEHDRRAAVDELETQAIRYLEWEIMQAGKLPTLAERLEHLKTFELFKQVNLLSVIEQQVYAEKIEQIGFSKQAVQEQLEAGANLREQITDYLAEFGSARDANPNVIADLIFKDFSKEGRFFHSFEDKVFLLYKQKIFEVGNNRPFNALIKSKTGLLPTEQPGRSVWESLASEAYSAGHAIKMGSWLYTDKATDNVFLNLNSPKNSIIKINTKSIEIIHNGLNDDDILLQSSHKMEPFSYDTDAHINTGISELKKLLFDNFSCKQDSKFLLICWMISCFVSEFSPHVSPLLKAEGETGSGKTTAARLIEHLLYGSEHLGDISVAGAYAEAATNPLVVIDNLENQDIKNDVMKFLLLVATRGSKTKRKGGTESGVTEESPKSLVMITAIEPFIKSELINRTLVIQFSKHLYNSTFIDDEATRQILRRRNLILSAILKLIQSEIIPNLEQRTAYISVLNMQFRGHSKDRLNSYLALMMLILEKLLRHWDAPAPKAADIWANWIRTQNEMAQDHEVQSNSILQLLDGLIRAYRLEIDKGGCTATPVTCKDGSTAQQYTHPEYGIPVTVYPPKEIPEDREMLATVMEFEAKGSDLSYAFTRFCKNQGMSNPYPTASIFSARLKNERNVLEKAGWELMTKDSETMYFKTVRGQHVFKFRHTFIR